MPAFNAADTIEASILSALLQNEVDLELIIIDDQSTDSTFAIALNASALDDRIRVLQANCNGGPAAARNMGIAAARGEWIALLDADDLYSPHRLARLIELARVKGAEMVADNLLITSTDATVDPYILLPSAHFTGAQQIGLAAFVAGNSGCSRTTRESLGFLQPLVLREFLTRHDIRYDERNRFGEDYLFYLRCLSAGARWWVTPEAMYTYRASANSATARQSSGDLKRISDAERVLLADPAVRADPQLVAALRRHKAKIDRSYFYRAFTDAVKARHPGTAAGLLFQSPQSCLAIGQEAALQTPTVMRKVLCGGYGLAASRPPGRTVQPRLRAVRRKAFGGTDRTA